ncbi:hypothetical protein VX159_08385 [Dechloromonas sp. ZY10]|uniref:hypothetical protein n=1 Tax=Dechloromonas aquae TaxID=2664436 RepID=UPI003529CB48
MLSVAGFTLFFFATSLVLALSGRLPPWLAAHLAFAAGVVPLILAAMIHFVPVLTRSGDPAAVIRRLPFLAQAVGLLVLPALLGMLPHSLLALIATVDAVLAAILLRWVWLRAHRSLGTPHPGWRWYAGALVCLMLAMLAVIGLVLAPESTRPLRLAHLHLNTLGLVGLAALGTLPVLLPTALGQPDPEAARWLQRMRWPMFAGVALVAGGTMLSPLGGLGRIFAASGAAALMIVCILLAAQWLRRFGMPLLAGDGVALPLFAALFGFVCSLLLGVAHGFGLMPGQATLLLWLPAFLLPLVSGALSQLLPVWRWPGPALPCRRQMRATLAWLGQIRAVLWLTAGALFAAEEVLTGSLLLLVGLASWVLNLAKALRIPRSTQ